MIRAVLLAGWRLSGQRDVRLLKGLVWAALEGGCVALPYALLYLLLDALVRGSASHWFVCALGLAMLACMALRIFCGVRGMPLIFAGAYAMMGQARLRIAEHLRALPMGWLMRQRGADLSARLTSDIDLIEQLWSHFLGASLSALVSSALLILFLSFLDWQLTLLLLATLPLALLLLTWTQRTMSQPGRRLLSANLATQTALLEYIEGIAVFRCFGRWGMAWQRLEHILSQQHHAMLSLELKPAPWLAGFGLVLELGCVALVWCGAQRIVEGTLMPSLLLVFLVLTLPLCRQIFDLGVSILLLRFAHQALARVEALLAQPVLVEPAVACLPQGHDIVFDRVCFAYEEQAQGDAMVLREVSCAMAAHSLTAIVGPSGAGKSTLVQLIARLWDVHSGAVRIGGVDVRDMTSETLHRQVAMVFQEVQLFSGSVLDNLRIGCRQASRAEVIVAAQRAQAHDFISALPQAYDTPLDEGGTCLSGGERQRIAIARALLKDAPILLLDEATASVDPSAAAEIQRAIGELARGRTVVVIAHQLHSVRHADHILVLDQGRLVEQGRHAALLAQGGLYERLWRTQQQARQWQLSTAK